LLEILWPGSDMEEAGKYLNDAAYRLRAVLRPTKGGESLLLTAKDTSSYALVGQEQLWVDADAALSLLELAEECELHGGDVLPLLEEAAGYLSRGEFLAEEEDLFFYGRRARVARARRGCLLTQARVYSRQGWLRRGESLLSSLLEENPLDEDALGVLMLTLHQQGRTAEGLRLYEETRVLLEREGLTPTEATQAVAHQLRAELPLAGEYLPYALLPPLSDLSSDSQQARSQELFIPLAPTATVVGASVRRGFALPIAVTQPEASLEIMIPDFATQLGFMYAQMITLIQQWYGMARFCQSLQAQVDQHIKKLDELKSLSSFEAYTLSRRSFLIALAALPTTLLTSNKQEHKISLELEEFLPQCAASIISCWHLSGGGQLDAIVPIIDAYLPTLVAVTKDAPSYREIAADLVAQCYFLKAILAWHLKGLPLAETYSLRALYYSDIAKNTNLRLTALNQHALISYYAKQFSKALAKSEEAFAILQHTSQERIFPIVRGRVSMYLAALQAQQSKGDAEQTLEQARHTFDLQAALAEAVPLYADCGEAPLTLWDGLTHYHLSLRNPAHAERALISLRIFGQLQSTMENPERFRLECLTNRILAAVRCNEMEEAMECFSAAKRGSIVLESKQRNIEVDFANRQMLQRWPREKKVQRLGAFPGAEE